jgi:hypothetical protein
VPSIDEAVALVPGLVSLGAEAVERNDNDRLPGNVGSCMSGWRGISNLAP